MLAILFLKKEDSLSINCVPGTKYFKYHCHVNQDHIWNVIHLWFDSPFKTCFKKTNPYSYTPLSCPCLSETCPISPHSIPPCPLNHFFHQHHQGRKETVKSKAASMEASRKISSFSFFFSKSFVDNFLV